MLNLIFDLWYLWALLILAGFFKIFKPVIKGWLGEKTIALYLKMLPQDDYVIINDVILPNESGTTQIDHIVVSVYGIFVIETKNYTGWIYGSEKSAQWTLNIYGKKSSFMNPIRQNFAHIKAIESSLSDYPGVPIIPIIAFSANCDLKVKTTTHVVYFHRVVQVIRKYKEKVIDPADVSKIVSLLRNADIKTYETKKEHVELVKEKKTAFENAAAGGACPKCGGLLIERNGNNGSFIGCSNYPKCRFTKAM